MWCTYNFYRSWAHWCRYYSLKICHLVNLSKGCGTAKPDKSKEWSVGIVCVIWLTDFSAWEVMFCACFTNNSKPSWGGVYPAIHPFHLRGCVSHANAHCEPQRNLPWLISHLQCKWWKTESGLWWEDPSAVYILWTCCLCYLWCQLCCHMDIL